MEAHWKRELAQLLAAAKKPGDVRGLLQALLTPVEVTELAKRWQIVKRLIREVPQRQIRDSLAVSIATVTRGSRELKYGNGILQKFYKRLRRR